MYLRIRRVPRLTQQIKEHTIMKRICPLFLLFAHTVAVAVEVDPEAVVRQIIGRSRLVQSGLFELSVTTKSLEAPSSAARFRVIVDDKGKPSERRRIGFLSESTRPWFPHYHLSDLIVSEENTIRLNITVAGDEWVAYNPAVPSTVIGRVDFTATHTERAPQTGDVQRNLLIEPARNGLTSSDEGLHWQEFLQCGTVPELLLSFLSEPRAPDGARRTGESIEVFWRLSQKELGSIFGRSTPVFLYAAETSLLKLTTVPAQGYVLSRVEFLSLDQHQQVTFNSTGFRDAGNGVFFPSRTEYICVSPFNMEHITYNIHRASDINDPVPEKAFELTLLPGTKVRNTLPGLEAVFTVGETAGATSIHEAIQFVPLEPIPGSSAPGRVILLFASVGIGLLLLMVYVSIEKTKPKEEK